MSHIRVLICRVDDPTSDQLTKLAAFDLPAADAATLQGDAALDNLETTTHTTANAILRRVLPSPIGAALCPADRPVSAAFFPAPSSTLMDTSRSPLPAASGN